MLYKHERDDRRERDAERMRQQARLVSAFIAGLAKMETLQGRSILVAGHELRVQNRSEEPVYDVRVEQFDQETGELLNEFTSEVEPPDGHRSFHTGSDSPAIEIEFTDSAGLRWRRDRDGRLGPS